MDWSLVKMGRNDRGALIGATGTGKTYLARFLIEDVDKPHSVVYDTKPSEAIAEWDHEFIESIDELQEIDPGKQRRVIYRPSRFEMRDVVVQDKFFEWVYVNGSRRVFIDEAGSIAGGSNPGYNLQDCLTRGREKGVSTLVGTQRPARIPVVLMSEAEHYYIFRLNWPYDREKVTELTGGNITVRDQLTLNEYEFFYFNAIKGIYVGDGQFARVGTPKKLKVQSIY